MIIIILDIYHILIKLQGKLHDSKTYFFTQGQWYTVSQPYPLNDVNCEEPNWMNENG